MIARKHRRTHADDPEPFVYLPCAYDHQAGEWRPIVASENDVRTGLDAARACHEHWLPAWSRIQRLVRRLRAFCEHPEFSFVADGINAKMMRDGAQELADAVELGDPDIRRLFSSPGQDDRFRIGETLYDMDPTTGALRAIPTESQDTLSADTLFLRAVRRARASAERMASQRVSRDAIENALDLLWLDLQPVDDPREPMQFVADQRFVETIADIAARIRARTKHGVSARGMQEVITVLTYWLHRLVQVNGLISGAEDVFWAEEDLTQTPGEVVEQPPDESDGVVHETIDDDVNDAIASVIRTVRRLADLEGLQNLPFEDVPAHGSGRHEVSNGAPTHRPETENDEPTGRYPASAGPRKPPADAPDDSGDPGEDVESDEPTGQKSHDESPDDDEPGGTSDP